jgi:hypothetical protein
MVTSKESLYFFLVAAKRRNLPDECAKLVISYTEGINGYLGRISEKFLFYTVDHDYEHFQHLLGKDIMLTRTREHEYGEWMMGMIAPLKYSETAQALVLECMVPTGHSADEIEIEEGIFVTNFEPHVVRAIYNILQPSSTLTQPTFDLLFEDSAVVPYISVVIGFIDYSNRFLNLLPSQQKRDTFAEHLIVLGMLCREQYISGFEDWVNHNDKLLHEVTDFLVYNKKIRMLQKLEDRLDMNETSEGFKEYLVLSMVLCDGFNKTVKKETVENDELVMRILKRLLAKRVHPKYIMKFECIINLNVRTKEFRVVYDKTIQALI